MEELGAGGIATGAAVVVGRVPVGEAHEEHGVNGVGDIRVSKPDRLAPFLAAGAHPLGQPMAGVGRFDDHGLHEVVLAGEEQLAARLRGGDRRRGHELRHLVHGVGPQVVVTDRPGHARPDATCCAHHA